MIFSCQDYSRVIVGDIINLIQSMVRRTKKERVWEPKQSKKSRKRVRKVKRIDIYEEQSDDSVNRHQKENHLKQNDQDQIQEQMQIESSFSQKIVQEIKQKSFEQEQDQCKQRQEQLKSIKQKALIKQVLFSQVQDQFAQSLAIIQRSKEQNMISNFLSSQNNREVSDLLYIYGSPGIGKTYLLKNMLIQKQLWSSTVWLNCFSILSKEKMNFHKNSMKCALPFEIIVLDEFDQLQSYLHSKSFVIKFKNYIMDLQSQAHSAKGGRAKLILVSNKANSSFQDADGINTVFNYNRMIQIPFLPYTLPSISEIIHKKIKRIESKQPTLSFNHKLIDIAVNKKYLTSQDIRRVIQFIVENYELLILKEGEESRLQEKVRFIEQISKNKIKKEEQENLDCSYLKLVSGVQKLLLKEIILGFEEAEKNKSLYLTKNVYKQIKRLGVSRHSVDVWLKEWQQMGILQKSVYCPKREHYLYKDEKIRLLIPLNQWKRHFY